MKSDRGGDNYSDKSDDERERERRGRRSERQSRFSSGGGDRERSPRGKKRAARVFVSNIPYEYRWQELKDLFREQVGEVSFVELFVDENDKPRGCGVIEFANPELAKEAVDKMHRYDLKGRKLVVKEDSDVERDKFGRVVPRGESGRGGGGGMGGGRLSGGRDDRGGSSWGDLPSLVNGPGGGSAGNPSKWGNTYGLSIQFLESLSINGPLVPRCFVANLDYKVDEKKLREVFRLAGRVISAEISLDKEGKSRGFGVVEYEHPVEAVQAISMFNNQMLYDRRLSVRMDRADKGDGLPAKLPEGLKSIGMGLGANGVPLQDVARNLPNGTNSPQASVNIGPPNNAALTAAALGVKASDLDKLKQFMKPTIYNLDLVTPALGNSSGLPGQLEAVRGLMGAPNSDLGAMGTTFGFGNTNPLANNSNVTAQLLNNASGGSGLGGLGSGASGRDFDSLSAALSAGNAFNFNQGSSSLDRGRPLGGGGGGPTTNRPSSDTIIVKNLPPGTTWQLLRDKCRDAGDVKFAEMRGKDTGVVQFATQWDAQRAVNMLDGIRVDGRTIDVRFF